MIVLFDGICNLCSGAVRFIIHHDKHGQFRFAAVQSAAGQTLQAHYQLDALALNTMVLIKDNDAYTKSEAALLIARHLGRPWSWLALLRVIPRPLRDSVYTWIAQHRYDWFGFQQTCMVPNDAIRSRFLS